MSLRASPSGRYLLVNGDGELYLDLSIAGQSGGRRRSLPLNLALVIDRSGSMAGQKLEQAKGAARALVSRLRDGDRIAIVTYGSDVTVLAPSAAITDTTRPRILSAIDSIVDRGGTFLSGGLASSRSVRVATGKSQLPVHAGTP